jgi:hypothetical protein
MERRTSPASQADQLRERAEQWATVTVAVVLFIGLGAMFALAAVS